jgi:hypothetical protein
MNQQTQVIRARLAEQEPPKPQLSQRQQLRNEAALWEHRLDLANQRMSAIRQRFDYFDKKERHSVPISELANIAQELAPLEEETTLLKAVIQSCNARLERFRTDLQGLGPENPDQRVVDYRYLRGQYADLFAYANALGSSREKMNTPEGRAELDNVNSRIAAIGKELTRYGDIAKAYDAQLRQAEENAGERRD